MGFMLYTERNAWSVQVLCQSYVWTRCVCSGSKNQLYWLCCVSLTAFLLAFVIASFADRLRNRESSVAPLY